MIRIYIVDDEKKSIDNLEYLLNQDINEDIIIKSSNDPLDAIEQIRKFEPDLLFLDVQMPHLDGFGIIKALGKIDFEIIFITAYEQYAIDAIRNSALDYLLKPIDGDDLMSAFNRFKIKREKKDKINEESISALASNGKIAIQQLEGIHFIEINKILRLEPDGNYTKIFSDDGSFIISSKTLKKYEDLLENHEFIRVHNSHLVNYKKIKSIMRNEILILEDGKKVPLSRRRRKELRTILGLE